MKLLSRWNWLQRLTLVLLCLLVLNSLAYWLTGYPRPAWAIGALLILAFLILLPFAALPPIVRLLSWRVRNRLFVTYVLVGVLPIVLIVGFVNLGFLLVLGQVTNYLLHAELDRRMEQVRSVAERAAQEAVGGIEVSLRGLESGESVIVRTRDKTWSIPESGPLTRFPEWSTPRFTGVVADASGNYFLAARAASDAGDRHVEAFAVRRFDNAVLAQLLPDLASVRLVEGATVRFRIGTFQDEQNIRIALNSEEVTPTPAPRGFWDSGVESGSPLEIRSLETGETRPSAITVRFHSSAVLARVFSTLGQTAGVLALFMGFVAFMFLVVEGAAIVASVQLARTLTGTVHDLYEGTKKVESGDFSHKIPVRSNDQLSALAASFNDMTSQIQKLIEEVKEKEKLEAELEIARQVQAQLFPREVPKLASLELAGVCNPARVVSGDYYDFIPIESRGAAIIIGDISGKGISAALLMASVQASLHAQLAMVSNQDDVSTATLVSRLNRQIYENTPPEKYVTFYCAIYDDQKNRLTYTNAGHLAPILIRNGQILRLESNGTVVGMFPEYPFEQTDVELERGDLLAAFTDGITESENASEEQFGDERLVDLLVRNSGKPLNEILQIVMDTIGKWAHDPSTRDDITMLLARKL